MFDRSRLEVVLVAVVATAAQLPTYALSHVPLDEGQIVQIGYRLLNGERLYGDIYTGIFPGIYWLAAVLLGLFGTDVVVTRWAAVFVNTATMVALWNLTRRLANRDWAWLTTVLYVALGVLSFPAFTMLAYSSVSLLCALTALLFLLRYLEDGRARDGAAAGALVVLCGIFKQNYGGLVLVSGLVTLLWSRRDSVLAQRSLREVMTAPVIAGLVVGLPVIGYVAWVGTFSAFIFDTLIVIASSQLDAYRQPVPAVFGEHPLNDGRFIFMYSPPLFFNYLMRGTSYARPEIIVELIHVCIRVGYGAAFLALLAAPVLLADRLRSLESETRHAARVVLPFACLFFLGLFPSAIWSHLAVVLIPLLIILVLLAKRVADLTDRTGPVSIWLRRAAIAAITCAALAILLKGSKNLREWHSEPMNLAGASLRVDPQQAALWREGTDFVETCAYGDATIFVAPDMPLLYMLTGKRNPTPFDLIIPGNVEDDVIVARMRGAGTRCVVYNPNMYAQFSPFDRLFPETAAYFANEFEVKRRLGSEHGGWLGLQRKEGRDGA